LASWRSFQEYQSVYVPRAQGRARGQRPGYCETIAL